MEPLDPKLARKFASARSLNNIPKAVAPYKSESFVPNDLEGKLRWYVAEARKAADPNRRKKDIASYPLTMHNLKCIESSTGISFCELRNSGKRDALRSLARSIFTYIERRMNNRSYPEIAAILNADHTSCMHMLSRFRGDYESSKLFQLVMRDEEMYMLFDRARRRKHGQ